MAKRYFEQHPFKEGILAILHQHFSDSIVDNFILEFEVNVYNQDMNKAVRAQLKDNNLILEVRYQEPKVENSVYICDVYSWESRKRTEYHLLRYITDKLKEGKIGKNWIEKGGVISSDISSGRLET